MEIIKDTFQLYKELERKIGELEDGQIKLKKEVANYVVEFGKYKGKTLAEIAYKDPRYYIWLKREKLIPYVIHPKIDIYIMTAISDHIGYEIARRDAEMLEKQGFRGRYD